MAICGIPTEPPNEDAEQPLAATLIPNITTRATPASTLPITCINVTQQTPAIGERITELITSRILMDLPTATRLLTTTEEDYTPLPLRWPGKRKHKQAS